MAARIDRCRARLAVALLVGLVAGGCAGRDPFAIDDPLKLKRVSLAMAAGANDNRPARVELVRVGDKRLLDQLITTDTTAWFGGADEAFHRANPRAVSNAWELVPGHVSGPVNVKAKGRFAGVLFCDAPAGSAPFRLERDGNLTVVIDDSGCRLEGGKRQRSIGRVFRRSKKVDLSFAMGPAANGNRPLHIQMVRVDDTALVADLARLSGAAWFGAGGRAFRRDHPDAAVDDWELVPGSRHGPFRLAVNGRVNGVLFCGPTPDLPLEVPWRRKVAVQVDADGCSLAATRRSRSSSSRRELP